MDPTKVSFGYKSPIKDIMDTCAYTGKKIPRKLRSVEHIKPKSKGGPNKLENYLMVERNINSERSNTPFHKWLKEKPNVVKHIQNFLNKYRGKIVEGKNYVEEVKKTLNKEAKGAVTFKGNKKLDIKA